MSVFVTSLCVNQRMLCIEWRTIYRFVDGTKVSYEWKRQEGSEEKRTEKQSRLNSPFHLVVKKLDSVLYEDLGHFNNRHALHAFLRLLDEEIIECFLKRFPINLGGPLSSWVRNSQLVESRHDVIWIEGVPLWWLRGLHVSHLGRIDGDRLWFFLQGWIRGFRQNEITCNVLATAGVRVDMSEWSRWSFVVLAFRTRKSDWGSTIAMINDVGWVHDEGFGLAMFNWQISKLWDLSVVSSKRLLVLLSSFHWLHNESHDARLHSSGYIDFEFCCQDRSNPIFSPNGNKSIHQSLSLSQRKHVLLDLIVNVLESHFTGLGRKLATESKSVNPCSRHWGWWKPWPIRFLFKSRAKSNILHQTGVKDSFYTNSGVGGNSTHVGFFKSRAKSNILDQAGVKLCFYTSLV